VLPFLFKPSVLSPIYPLSLHDALPISPAQTIIRAWRQGANPHHSRCWIPHIRGKGGMISFKSIFSRIIFLHVIALVITAIFMPRSEEHTSELQSLTNLVCRLLLEKKNF